jgi:hypothetical protein
MAGKWLAHLPQDTQDKITIGNASRVYNFTSADPPLLFHSVAQSRNKRWEDRQPLRFTCSRW